MKTAALGKHKALPKARQKMKQTAMVHFLRGFRGAVSPRPLRGFGGR